LAAAAVWRQQGVSAHGFGHGIALFFRRRAGQIAEKPKSKTRPNPGRDEILMGGAFRRLGRGDLQQWGGGAR